MIRIGTWLSNLTQVRSSGSNIGSIRRGFTEASKLLNDNNDKDRSKPKSHRPKTLEDLLKEQQENQKPLSTSPIDSESSTTKTSKPKALDIVNTGARIPENWRKMGNLPEWQRQRYALLEKFSGTSWAPKKKLSREDMQSVKILRQKLPDLTNSELAEHFRTSPEAIRRILKSKWVPTADEQEKLHERWKKRGVKVKNLLREQHAELKTPKIIISSKKDYNEVTYTKNGNYKKSEKKIDEEGFRDRLRTRKPKGLRAQKF